MVCGVLACLTAGCSEETKRVRALAGEYVFEARGSTSHIRRTLTLREDWTWSRTNHVVMNGVRQPSSTDSGSFNLHRDRIVVNSPRDGITKFMVVGDTLWSDPSEEEAMDRVITGQASKLNRFYFVRNRGLPAGFTRR
jgi:hypothetical protein